MVLDEPTENGRKSFGGPAGSPRDKLFFAKLQQTLSNLRHRIQVAASNTNQKDFLTFQLLQIYRYLG